MAKRCGKLHGNVMIERIVGRIHVGTPPDEAVNYVKSRMASGAWEKLTPAVQRSFDCEVRRVHAENLKMYRDVMEGRF
jgi:hypothetical protein